MLNHGVTFKGLEFGRVFLLPAGKRQIEFKFQTTTGENGRVAVDLGDLSDIRVVQRQLRNSGFGGDALTRSDAKTLDELVMRYSKSRLGRSALTPVQISGGWNSKKLTFALDDFELPGGRAVSRPPNFGNPISHKNGTLSRWKSTVGKLATHSSRTMVMISAALAAPTLALLNVEAGGFGLNLWGPSSSGKTTALRAAASVLAGDVVGTWNGTALGIQDVAKEYCDLPLTIDSMECVSGDGQRDLAEAVAYALGNGKTRLRSKAWTATAGVTDSPWRTVLLSTAEAKQPRANRTGAAVRLIDIPVAHDVESALGIVDYIPVRIPADRHRAFSASVVEGITKGISENHGHLLPAFITFLAANRKSAVASLTEGQTTFLQRLEGLPASNTESRILKSFAITFAAGRLGIACGLLPWSEEHLIDAVKRCATDALENTSDRVKQNAENASRVLSWVSDPARIVVSYSTELTSEDIAHADIISAEVTGDEDSDAGFQPVSMVLRQTLQRALHLTGKELAGAMTCLKDHGRLATEGRNDALTVQYKFRNFSTRFYVILSLDDGGLHESP